MSYDSSLRLDSEGNMIDVQGNIVVPSHAVSQYSQYIAAMRRQSRVQRQQAPAPTRGSRQPSNENGRTQPARAHYPDFNDLPVLPNDSLSSHSSTSHINQQQQQRHSDAYSGAHSSYITATATPATLSSGSAQQQQWAQQPQESPAFPFADSWFPPAAHAPEQSGQLGYDLLQSSPPRSRATPTNPTIRVTSDQAEADWAQDFSGTTQPPNATCSASSQGSPLPQNDYNSYTTFRTGTMGSTYQMPQDPEMMQTPVSPVSADNTQHDHAMVDEQQHLSRKRSHSVMSQQDTSLIAAIQQQQQQQQQQNHSRQGSIVSQGASPNDQTEGFSPRGSRAFKRGDPPVNAQGKYVCNYAPECEGQIFERKCEWSKHMDKHDRPYRCPHPQCAKLQGFTYSGGLLRHEREVHGKHGGPKSQMMCPHTDCKRHTGKGFTRKENLNEHLRRVHPNDKDSQTSMLARTATELSEFAENAEDAIQKIDNMEQNEFDAASPAKRKRSLPPAIDSALIDDPEREIKRLRAELAHREHVIHHLEQEVAAHEETKRQLHALQQLHQDPQLQQHQQQQPEQPQMLPTSHE